VSALALAAGLAVREAVARMLPQHEERDVVRVKWPNDVWVENKKVAGVLAESQLQGGQLVGAVVGFGVNVVTAVFPNELKDSATSLQLLGASAAREVLLADTLAALEERTNRLLGGGVQTLVPELSKKDALKGRRVRIDQHQGVAAGIDASGRLRLRLEGGTGESFVEVAAGTVELLD
jgi:BirA family biotin operon repressor/biotin-[acetyl-CoA-carboxylase] ligase